MICPLDWGLGHATRCVPIIRALDDMGFEVLIAADANPLAYLKNIFPHLEFIRLPGYKFRYPGKGNMALNMLLSAPLIIAGIIKEHFRLKKIVRETHIDGVISDNRFGLWNKTIPSVFITHQVNIQTGIRLRFLSPIINGMNHLFIRRYKSCWIPDYEEENNLSGNLSHHIKAKINKRYIGPLSRFHEISDNDIESGYKYEIAFILSGPEPQRTILEQTLLNLIKLKDIRVVIVRGVINSNENFETFGKTDIYSYIDFIKLREIIQQSSIIVCRPGYSTLMDLEAIGRRAVLIPTPGQTEQEYLAYHLEKTRGYFTFRQDNLDIERILQCKTEKTHPSGNSNELVKREIMNTFGHLLKE